MMQKFKATRKNLIKEWILKEKLLTLYEFWDECGFFLRENWQRVQNYSYELSTEEFKKVYESYVNDTNIINIKNYKELFKWIYILDKNIRTRDTLLTLYFESKKIIDTRIVKKIKKIDWFWIKVWGEYVKIDLINL